MTMKDQKLLPGDLVAFSGKHSWSRWSHVVLVVHMKRAWAIHFGYTPPSHLSKVLLIEGVSSCLSPCDIAGKCTMGIQAHSIWGFLDAWGGQRAYIISRKPKFWLTMQEQRELAYMTLRLLGSDIFYRSNTTPRDIIRFALSSDRYNKPKRIV